MYMDEMNMNIKPTDDFIFKRIFGVEESKDILISFLNALFKEYEYLPNIKNIKFSNNENIKDDLENKDSRLDIKATTDGGNVINIEVQTTDNGNLINRGIYYCSKMIVDGTYEGYDYDKPEVISIWIIKNKIRQDNIFYDRGSAIEISQLYSPPTKENDEYLKNSNKLTIVSIFLYKFKEGTFDIDIEQWLRFIDNRDISDVENKQICKANEKLNYLRSSKDMKDIYDSKLKFLLHKNTDLKIAKQDGLKEGKIEMVKNMLKKNMDINLISELSGLSIEEINNINCD